jgi:hypothetical protein
MYNCWHTANALLRGNFMQLKHLYQKEFLNKKVLLKKLYNKNNQENKLRNIKRKD